MSELSPVKGYDPVVGDICRMFDVNPKQCKRMTIDFPADGVVTATFTLMPDREQLTAMKERLEPVAERVRKKMTDEPITTAWGVVAEPNKLSEAEAERIRGQFEEAMNSKVAAFPIGWTVRQAAGPMIAAAMNVAETGPLLDPGDENDSDQDGDCDGPVIVEGK